MEGRATNTPGGKAAGDYLADEFTKLGLQPAGPDGPYFQDCGNGCRNVLGLLKGSDPTVVDETVIVCAHYDHVGVRRRGCTFANTPGTMRSFAMP